MSQEPSTLVGVDRLYTDDGLGDKWNKKRLRWIFTHHTPYRTRQHTVDLYMVLLSSERVVKVDEEERLRAMV